MIIDLDSKRTCCIILTIDSLMQDLGLCLTEKLEEILQHSVKIQDIIIFFKNEKLDPELLLSPAINLTGKLYFKVITSISK